MTYMIHEFEKTLLSDVWYEGTAGDGHKLYVRKNQNGSCSVCDQLYNVDHGSLLIRDYATVTDAYMQEPRFWVADKYMPWKKVEVDLDAATFFNKLKKIGNVTIVALNGYVLARIRVAYRNDPMDMHLHVRNATTEVEALRELFYHCRFLCASVGTLVNERGEEFKYDRSKDEFVEEGTHEEHIKKELAKLGETSLSFRGTDYVTVLGAKYVDRNGVVQLSQVWHTSLKRLWSEIVHDVTVRRGWLIASYDRGYFKYDIESNTLVKTDDILTQSAQRQLAVFSKMGAVEFSECGNGVSVKITGFTYIYRQPFSGTVSRVGYNRSAALAALWQECISLSSRLDVPVRYRREKDGQIFYFDAAQGDFLPVKDASISDDSYKNKFSVLKSRTTVERVGTMIKIKLLDMIPCVDGTPIRETDLWHFGPTEGEAYKNLWRECKGMHRCSHFKNTRTNEVFKYNGSSDSFIKVSDFINVTEQPCAATSADIARNKLSVMSDEWGKDSATFLLKNVRYIDADNRELGLLWWPGGCSIDHAYEMLWAECKNRCQENRRCLNTVTGDIFIYDKTKDCMVRERAIQTPAVEAFSRAIEESVRASTNAMCMRPCVRSAINYKDKLSVMSNVFTFDGRSMCMSDMVYIDDDGTTTGPMWMPTIQEGLKDAYEKLWIECKERCSRSVSRRRCYNTKTGDIFIYDATTDGMIKEPKSSGKLEVADDTCETEASHAHFCKNKLAEMSPEFLVDMQRRTLSMPQMGIAHQDGTEIRGRVWHVWFSDETEDMAYIRLWAEVNRNILSGYTYRNNASGKRFGYCTYTHAIKVL